MANSEESSPLLANQSQNNTANSTINNNNSTIKTPIPNSPTSEQTKQSPPTITPGCFHHHQPVYGWTADGLPFPNVIGEPLPRAQWESGLFACLGHNDEFCSSDLEVCEFSFTFC